MKTRFHLGNVGLISIPRPLEFTGNIIRQNRPIHNTEFSVFCVSAEFVNLMPAW